MRRILAYFSTSKPILTPQIQNFILFAKNEPNSLSTVAQKFTKQNIQMTHIKSKLKNSYPQKQIYQIEVSAEKANDQQITKLREDLNQLGVIIQETESIKVPWFPTKIQQLDFITTKSQVKKYNLSQSQCQDEIQRRQKIGKITCEYRMGAKIPNIQYTENQKNTWKNMFQKLRNLHKSSMCQLYEQKMTQMQNQLKMNTNIPQLNELSQYLQSQTGFRLKPIDSNVTEREFLNCFAHKVLCCAQYLRFTSKMEHTSEPDAIHGIIGHIPLLADPEVAEMCHWIGILSLGASNDQISQLASLYWYTLQFGVCKEEEMFKGYGAGIASSIKQMQNVKSQNAKFQRLNPQYDSSHKYCAQKLQSPYRSSQSLSQCFNQLKKFGKKMLKPFFVSVNPATGEIFCDRKIEMF